MPDPRETGTPHQERTAAEEADHLTKVAIATLLGRMPELTGRIDQVVSPDAEGNIADLIKGHDLEAHRNVLHARAILHGDAPVPQIGTDEGPTTVMGNPNA